jgi:large subunit ribosomal protein L31
MADMKARIHPKWFEKAKIICACGSSFTTGATKEEIRVDICHKCHPFFTGEQKFVDAQGRVEKFQSQQKAVAGKPYVKKQDKKRLARKKAEEEEKKRPQTLREMLTRVKK